MLTLFHRTTTEAAVLILGQGFRDGRGRYLTTQEWTGVWVSDVPLDNNEGATGEALLRIALTLDESEIAHYEWIEEGKGYREWLIPAALLNEHGSVCLIEDDDAVPRF
jgi:hypothetical protein